MNACRSGPNKSSRALAKPLRPLGFNAEPVTILDAGDAIALGGGERARDRAPRAHLGAGLSCVGEVGDERVGERADRTADMAPAVVDAG